MISKIEKYKNIETGKFFMGIPERWMDDPTWRCINNHVSKRFLKSEKKGDCCLKCGANCYLTFPEDNDGELL